MDTHEKHEDRSQKEKDSADDRDEDDREVLVVIQFTFLSIAPIEQTVPFHLVTRRVFIDCPRSKLD